TQLTDSPNFCPDCGAPVHRDDSHETMATPTIAAALPEVTAAATVHAAPGHVDALVVVRGATAGETLELAGEVTSVGRQKDNDLVLDDVTVSRHHALFTTTASGRVTVRDLNSLNGTYVNGSRVEEVTLRTFDEVQIGKFKLTFVAAADR
ncbi:MAG TPA: FHA domain-containing protein, partial [Acidimicrobiales bacterium]|nr:FHA domain-containing protein [Acidimicrobiales bacterium]